MASGKKKKADREDGVEGGQKKSRSGPRFEKWGQGKQRTQRGGKGKERRALPEKGT